MFNFDYSYLNLPNKFYSFQKPASFPLAQTFLLNIKLFKKFKLTQEREDKLIETLFKNKNHKKSYAQAYAGHQFGHFTKLGDGRAIIIGEHLTKHKQRFDIQLKGSGATIYSRNGDGKATLESMLREYLISEAMHYLKIKSSRSLAVIKTGEPVYRKKKEDGSILVRVMQSHIRIGTFEYASYFASNKDLKQLTYYTINRLYPEIKKYENPILALLNIVMEKQIDLVVNWMRVGFIHGVMNTDNISISAETFDYGPCAFINSYNAEKSYSSIDYNKRYAFGNQSKILKWNISRFAESLLPIIHQDTNKSIQLAQSVIDKFDEIWKHKYYSMMLDKIGIKSNKKNLFSLVDELLLIMEKMNMDFTNTFYYLSQGKNSNFSIKSNTNFIEWQKKWYKYINKQQNIDETKNLMKENNPVYIPRNNFVDDAIKKAVSGNMTNFNKLLNLFSNPYQYQKGLDEFMKPPHQDFEDSFQTFCGT